MMELVQLNVDGKEIAPLLTLDCGRRRLPSVICAHVNASRPFMIAVQRRSRLDVPIDESWVVRGWKRAPVKDEAGKVVVPGKLKPWPRKYLARDAFVVVVYLPHGSGASGGASRSKSPLSIALGIAGLALAAFAGPLGSLAAASFFSGSATAGALTSVGAAIGGSPVGSLVSRSRLSTREQM